MQKGYRAHRAPVNMSASTFQLQAQPGDENTSQGPPIPQKATAQTATYVNHDDDDDDDYYDDDDDYDYDDDDDDDDDDDVVPLFSHCDALTVLSSQKLSHT